VYAKLHAKKSVCPCVFANTAGDVRFKVNSSNCSNYILKILVLGLKLATGIARQIPRESSMSKLMTVPLTFALDTNLLNLVVRSAVAISDTFYRDGSYSGSC
jgi:hypothetical protein